MISRRHVVPVLLALLAVPAVADAPTILRTTPAGTPVRVRRHVELSSGCVGSAPTITFSVKPAHGTVDIRPDRFVFGKGYVSGAMKACEGQQVDGIAIWYTPAAGFHGVDQIAWTAGFAGRGHRVDSYGAQITVR
jgi:hypothetical protein